MIGLKASLNKSKDTTTRADEIHYQFIKHLPETSLNVLLSIYNDIWYSWKSFWLFCKICLNIKVDTDRTRTHYRPTCLPRNICTRRLCPMSVFFDFEKVFDTTWKYRITRDMYNIKGKMSILIRNFLVHWVFRVSLGNTISEGSVRSDTLFIKMYNIKYWNWKIPVCGFFPCHL